MRVLFSFALLSLAAIAQAASATGSRLLSIWESEEDRKLYSKLVKDLEDRKFTITHATPKTANLDVFRLGERSFDHIMVFPTKVKGLGPKLTANVLLDFVNAGGNILVALSSTQAVSTTLNSLLLELDITIPAERTGVVVDHFNYDVSSAAEQHDVLLVPPPFKYRSDVKDFFSQSATNDDLIAIPHGIGHVLGDGELLTPLIRAPRTAYLYNPTEQAETVDDVFASGDQLALVSVLQARNSARFTVVGSAEMFQDKWFDAKVKRPSDAKEIKSFNQLFAQRLTGWTFNELGYLRVNEIEHRLDEEGQNNASNPAMYRLKNKIVYTASLSEWVWDKWTTFLVPANDHLQLEFSMLSPFWRRNLTFDPTRSTGEEGVYTTTFAAPDQHGIFNFMLDYKRPFYSNIEEKRTVPVRHFAHDEWTRSFAIVAAWPWVTNIWISIVAWLGFLGVWMFSAPVRQAGVVKKTQ